MFRKKKSRVKLPLRAYLMYLTLLSFLLTGVTFSKYVTQSSSGDSARVVKFGNLAITESGDFNAEGKMVITPGVNLNKTAVVNVSPSEVVTYVFVKVDVSGFTTTDNRNFSFIGDLVQWSVDQQWYLLEGAGLVYYIALNANDDLSQNIITNNTITVSRDITESDLATYCVDGKPTIDFTAYMVQGGGFANPADAWRSIND